MKKLKLIILLGVILTTLTGCIKKGTDNEKISTTEKTEAQIKA